LTERKREEGGGPGQAQPSESAIERTFKEGMIPIDLVIYRGKDRRDALTDSPIHRLLSRSAKLFEVTQSPFACDLVRGECRWTRTKRAQT
jgi:hypothetical protein